MKNRYDIGPLKRIPIIKIAKQLGIRVRGAKAMCFTGHDRATPSLSFMSNRNTWRCFGACGKHGDGIALVMEKENLDFKSALGWFAQNFGVDVRQAGTECSPQLELSPPPLPKEFVFGADAEVYAWLLEHCPPVQSRGGLKYLASHGISLECATRFMLRELPEAKSLLNQLVQEWGPSRVHRSGLVFGSQEIPERLIWQKSALIFPFLENGVITYLQARMLGGQRKFLNPRGIPKPLFNLDRLEVLPAQSKIYLCEGIPDAIALEAHGLPAVGVLGATSFRPEWVEPFLKFNVTLLVQGDAAGSQFAADISGCFHHRGTTLVCHQLPAGRDAADVLAAGDKID